jgi:soluble lytic murein transglycosylase-like protein
VVLTVARGARLTLRPLFVAGTVVVLVVTGQAGLSGGPKGKAPALGGTLSYVVQPGDSLSVVAKRFSMSTKDLAAANQIKNIHRVRIGATLTIPVPKIKASSKLPPALLAHPERLTLLPLFEKWAQAYGVPADLLKALAWMESGWQNDVVSVVAARGIGQLTPNTVTFINDRLLGAKLDPAVPEHNIQMSSRYFAYLLGRSGGDQRNALAAYYQGFASVQKNGVLPVTAAYVADIVALQPMFT